MGYEYKRPTKKREPLPDKMGRARKMDIHNMRLEQENDRRWNEIQESKDRMRHERVLELKSMLKNKDAERRDRGFDPIGFNEKKRDLRRTIADGLRSGGIEAASEAAQSSVTNQTPAPPPGGFREDATGDQISGWNRYAASRDKAREKYLAQGGKKYWE